MRVTVLGGVLIVTVLFIKPAAPAAALVMPFVDGMGLKGASVWEHESGTSRKGLFRPSEVTAETCTQPVLITSHNNEFGASKCGGK